MQGVAGTPAKQIDLNALTVQAHFCPMVPIVINSCTLTIMNDVGGTGVCLFKYRPTAGSTTGEVTIATLNLTTAHTQGKIVGKSGLNHAGSPGGEYIVEVTDVTAANDLGAAMMWGYESYEQPGNLSRYVETA